jgi:hypothetical protein
LVVEVTHISEHGFWLLLPRGEVLVPFAAFPWFRDASVAQLQAVRLLHSDHLYWPELDVDLAVDSILHPERYPLVSRVRSSKPVRRSTGAGKVSDEPPPRRRASRR